MQQSVIHAAVIAVRRKRQVLRRADALRRLVVCAAYPHSRHIAESVILKVAALPYVGIPKLALSGYVAHSSAAVQVV